MARVIIFGHGDTAETAHYYLAHDSPHEVVAFSVTADLIKEKTFHGLPLLAFEEIQDLLPPDDHRFFVPMMGKSMNRLRERYYLEAKAKGYALISHVASGAHLCGNAIGENCFILSGAVIQPYASIGDNAVVWSHAHIGHHSVVEDHAFVSVAVAISGRCQVGRYSYLAANAVINDRVRLAEGTLVGLGAVVKQDTQPWGIYTGNPAVRRKVSSRDFEFL